MSTITDRISLFDYQGQALDLSQYKLQQMSEAPQDVYDSYIQNQERFLEAYYSRIVSDPESPRNQVYANVTVNGKTVASIDNNGYVTSSNAIGSRLHQILSQDNTGQPGPQLAQERAEKIAQLLGGKVETSATALSQSAYQATSAQSVSVDYDALKQDASYERLQQLKKARTLYLAQEMGQSSTTDTTNVPDQNFGSVVLNTTQGTKAMDIASLFDPKPQSGPIDLASFPIILPTADNIKALSEHVQAGVKEMLAKYNIPEAPTSISYDQEGKPVFPDDYAYKDEFSQALEENPVIARELHTVNALASHYAGLMNISNAGAYAKISLNFDGQGDLSVKINDRDFEGQNVDQSQQASQTYDKASEKSDAEKWFLDYMEKTPEQRLFEAILREKGMTPEEYEALPPEERVKIEQEIQEEMEKRTLAGMGTTPGSKNEQIA